MKPLIILASLALVCGACDSDKSPKSTPEEQVMEETAFVKLAREQALRLAPVENARPSDTLAYEVLLIDVRARESTLRRHGHQGLADSYITTFLQVLDSVNPSLADTIALAQE